MLQTNVFVLGSFVADLLLIFLELWISTDGSTWLLEHLLWCLLLPCLCHGLRRRFFPYILYPPVCVNGNTQMGVQHASSEVTPAWALGFQVLVHSLLLNWSLTPIMKIYSLFIFWASSSLTVQNITRISWSQPKKNCGQKVKYTINLTVRDPRINLTSAACLPLISYSQNEDSDGVLDGLHP